MLVDTLVGVIDSCHKRLSVIFYSVKFDCNASLKKTKIRVYQVSFDFHSHRKGSSETKSNRGLVSNFA